MPSFDRASSHNNGDYSSGITRILSIQLAVLFGLAVAAIIYLNWSSKAAVREFMATGNPSVSEPSRLPPEGVMDNLQIRPHERNPNLWWVSSQGDDVAYITRPGNIYLAWATDKWKPGHADFVGKRFDTVDEALQAVARSFS
jgi:hypothetical protein